MATRRVKTYTGEAIDVNYDLKRCIHAKECVNGLPAVFNTEQRPWIQPDNAGADDLAEVISRCPTGALHFDRKDDGPAEATPDQNTVEIVADGPVYVRGELTVKLSGAEDAETMPETRLALCRCGASQNKPFCDNSHKDIDFKDAGTPQVSQLGPEGENTGPLKIDPATDGPVLMYGNFEIVTAMGQVSFRGEKAALCRCGGSSNKPFCDGSHHMIDFKAE